MGEEGYLIQRRIITELCKLRKIPDDNVPNRDAALDALRSLKELAVQHNMLTEEKQTASGLRAAEAKRRQGGLLTTGKISMSAKKLFEQAGIAWAEHISEKLFMDVDRVEER